MNRIPLLRRSLPFVMAIAALAVPAAAAADGDPEAWHASPPTPEACHSAVIASLGAVDCTETPSGEAVAEPAAASAVPTLDEEFSRNFRPPDDTRLPAYCRIPAQVVVYTSSDWIRLGQKLLADASPCAEYRVSIPPLAANKTALRPLQDDAMRELGPRIHPVAEIHVGGWQSWVGQRHKTWYEAGVEARRVMDAAGYGSKPGETWAVNEFSSAVRLGTGNARANMREFLRGLYEGAPGMKPMRGIVYVIGLSQTVADTSVYRRTLQGWLQDAGFWTELDQYVDFFAQEVYADSRNWGVEGSSRHERAEHLSDYLEHLAILASVGPETAAPARDFLTRTYVPLASSAWPWASAFGNTMIDPDVMSHFVATQTYAIRDYAGSHPHSFPGDRIGFAYAPNMNAALPPGALAAGTGLIADRLASSLHYAYNRGGSAPVGACGPPGEHVWCDATVAGATFNSAWKLLGEWEATA